MYGLLEGQFARTMERATAMRGRSGENLLMLLERRLDSVVFRMGFATSRAEARQLERHGHFLVYGRKATVPSIQLKPGSKVTVRERSRQIARFAGALESVEGRSVPRWLETDKDKFEGTVKAMPTREDITRPIQEQLLVELYTR
jgi:small subunit ribosomal protein S4